MENIAVGPRPAPTGARGLSRAQQQVFDALLAADAPIRLHQLSASTGLHENTLRAHLDALGHAGLVQRIQDSPHGRGRPAWLWSVPPASRRAGGQYAGLAAALIRTLLRTSPHPRYDAIEAGRSWGQDLAADAFRYGSKLPPRESIAALLDELGFAPEPDPRDPVSTTRLTRCPLLDLAREHPEIVCNVHLGLIGGALESRHPGADHAADAEVAEDAEDADHAEDAEEMDADLVPFAEPGACLLHLRAVSDHTRVK